MVTLEGMGTSGGISSGKILIIESEDNPPKRIIGINDEEELRKFNQALDTAKAQLKEQYDKAVKDVGEDGAAVFEIHSMMLQEPDYLNTVTDLIEQQSASAEYAVYVAGQLYSHILGNMDDSYMRERAFDVIEISRRVIHILTATVEDPLKDISDKVVVVAEDLMPSQTVQFDKNRIAALVTRDGSQDSHSSILARSMGVPSVTALNGGYKELQSGGYAIVDGTIGVVVVDPDFIKAFTMRKKMRNLRRRKYSLKKSRVRGRFQKMESNWNLALISETLTKPELPWKMTQAGSGFSVAKFFFWEEMIFYPRKYSLKPTNQFFP